MLERNRGYYLLTKEEQAKGKNTNWPEIEITGTVRNLSPELWKLNHLTALYLNDNSLYRLPPAISFLVNLRRLDLSNNKLRSLPSELGDLVQIRELMLNNNYLRSLPYELGKLFQLMILGLKGNPLGPDILSLYSEVNGTKKLLEFMLDNLHVTASPPPPRPWLPLAPFDRTKSTALFTVMCYNVLCDRYATRQMYGYCPQWALNWEYRKKGILDEVRHYGADIITLQEVETHRFYDFFLPELKHDGYEGIFSPKSRAKTMNENDRKHVDGCAIFYRTQKFSLIKEHLVEFNQVAMANAEGSDHMLNRVMTKDNIALAALLELKESCWENGLPPEPQALMVCTAHIHWDPEFCDVKLIQTIMLMDQLKRIVDEAGHSFRPGGHKFDSRNIQLLLCGDFNSLPDSGVVEYIQNGQIPYNHRDFKGLAYKQTLLKMLNSNSDETKYSHNFKLASAVTPDFMPYTNFAFDFKGMIDYIFYPKETTQPLGILGPISEEWIRENKVVGCPHPHITSDHFALLTEFGMTVPLSSSNSSSLKQQPQQQSHQHWGKAGERKSVKQNNQQQHQRFNNDHHHHHHQNRRNY